MKTKIALAVMALAVVCLSMAPAIGRWMGFEQ